MEFFLLLLTGGDCASIADLLCAATLDQTKEAGMNVAEPANNCDQIFIL